jgi:hypothetical protein
LLLWILLTLLLITTLTAAQSAGTPVNWNSPRRTSVELVPPPSTAFTRGIWS